MCFSPFCVIFFFVNIVGYIVFLYNSRLKLFPGKLKSRWTGPFEVTQVFPSRAIEIKNQDRASFKVNGQRLKVYINDSYDACLTIIELRDPVILK